MGRAKVLKIVLDDRGSYLGMEKGCFVVRDRNDNVERFPLFENEVGEVVLKSGNAVSTGALASLGFWGVDVLVLTQRGRPVAMLKSLDDDSHVETRVCQYEALKNGKGAYVAKQIVLTKITGENQVLKKHGLRQHDLMGVKERVNSIEAENLGLLRKRLLAMEGRCSKHYFEEVFKLFPKKLRPVCRRGFHAYDGVNNLFNLAYRLLFWKCYRALSKAHLETHLGFVHSLVPERPSLVCDFMELYRCLVDDFLIGFSRNLKPRHFEARSEMFKGKKGKRIYLKRVKTRELTGELHEFFMRKVRVPRFRHGNEQEVESLINEEAILLALFLRGRRESWVPRVAIPG
ncbi:MAG: CRISPR-associated endonuclease Cas1 [Candidatus Bathyarchaeota archaeon]|nr:MAG: CRISPR-associated endonuclease Cas1 [Candidatus Bathyarchaeota archaeon]